jgi:hypothetical protein
MVVSGIIANEKSKAAMLEGVGSLKACKRRRSNAFSFQAL